jgi:hypothetical protein
MNNIHCRRLSKRSWTMLPAVLWTPVTVPVLHFQTRLFRQEEDEDGEDNDILPVFEDDLRSTLMNRLEGICTVTIVSQNESLEGMYE